MAAKVEMAAHDHPKQSCQLAVLRMEFGRGSAEAGRFPTTITTHQSPVT